jgi:type III secretory pathway component EscT
MKHTLKFLYKVCLICLVAAVVFVLPAIIASLMFLDLSLYLKGITSPEYCVIMFFITMFVTCTYISYMVDKSKSNADTSK